MTILALSVADRIEQYGAYAGFAAVFGLAVLSMLYFAQAREVKRLREWAGRAPERAAELEARVAADAQRRAVAQPAQPVQPRPAAQPATPAAQAAKAAPAAAPGTVPATTPAAGAAAGAAAKAPETQAQPPAGPPATQPAGQQGNGAGAPEGEAPKPAPATAAASAPGATPPPAAAGAPGAPAAPGAPPAPGAPAKPAGGAPAPGTPEAPKPQGAKPATPAPARPAQPLRVGTPTATVPPRTAAGGRRGGGDGERSPARTTLAIVGAAAVVLAALVFVGVRVLGGDGEQTQPSGNTLGAPAPAQTAPGETPAAEPNDQEPLRRGEITVAVLNGTTVPGLARGTANRLQGGGFRIGVVTNAADQQRQGTVVQYAAGRRRAALEVARIVGLPRTAVQELDAGTRVIADGAMVVVTVGSDQNQQPAQ